MRQDIVGYQNLVMKSKHLHIKVKVGMWYVNELGSEGSEFMRLDLGSEG